jgi:hypothetical protein
MEELKVSKRSRKLIRTAMISVYVMGAFSYVQDGNGTTNPMRLPKLMTGAEVIFRGTADGQELKNRLETNQTYAYNLTTLIKEIFNLEVGTQGRWSEHYYTTTDDYLRDNPPLYK